MKLRSLSSRLQPSLLTAVRPVGAASLATLLPCLTKQPGHRSFGTGGVRDPLRGDDRTRAAQEAAEDFLKSAQDSVRHAAEGNPSAMAQDTMNMAQSAARGAYESAKLVADTLTGGMAGMGGKLGERSETGKAFERVSSAMSEAGGCVGESVSDATTTMTDEATTRLQQAAAGLAGNTPQATGPESTYRGHILRESRVPSPAEASAEELQQEALAEHWAGTPSPTGSGQRPIREETGFFGGTTSSMGPRVRAEEPGADVEVGLAGGHVSERSFDDDEFAITREEGSLKKD